MTVEMDWMVMAIFDALPPFVYTVGLWEKHGRPEFWMSCMGECGHVVSCQGATYVLNDMATDQLNSGLEASYAVTFDVGAVLSFVPGLPRKDLQAKLQTFQTPDDAPIIAVTWRCCDGIPG